MVALRTETEFPYVSPNSFCFSFISLHIILPTALLLFQYNFEDECSVAEV